MPKLKNNYYNCSTTSSNKVHYDPDKIKKWAKTCRWDSNFQLKENIYKYARVYIAYEEEGNPYEYTWILRRMSIRQCTEVDNIWNKINLNL